MTRDFDLSEVARHNDATHGYWLVIDRAVYDVSAFMFSHPGGDRILQLYAGRDASAGFARVHTSRSVLNILPRYRIGALRESCCHDAAHGGHHELRRRYESALQLSVEMQNALAADQSFCLEPRAVVSASVVSRYELQRALETHVRFQGEYLDVWVDDVLPGLLQAVTGSESWQQRLVELAASPQRHATRAHALEALVACERYADDALARLVISFHARDRLLLRALKRQLRRGLCRFERPHGQSLAQGAHRVLLTTCRRVVELIGEYFELGGNASAAIALSF